MCSHRPGSGPGASLRPRRSRASALTLALGVALACVASSWAQTVQNPRRIAAGPHGQVLVSDRRHSAVVAVDKRTLQPVWSYVLPNDGAPFGLATWNRLVYVGNTETRSVEVYRIQGSTRGKTLSYRYDLGHQPGLVENPIAIAVDPSAERVFVLGRRAEADHNLRQGGQPGRCVFSDRRWRRVAESRVRRGGRDTPGGTGQ